MPPQQSGHEDPYNIDGDAFVDNTDKTTNEETENKLPISHKIAHFTARQPLKVLLGTLTVATIFAVITAFGSDLDVSVDNKGWRSRGTVIANREMQLDVILWETTRLFEDTDGSAWEDLENNVSSGYRDYSTGAVEDRRLTKRSSDNMHRKLFSDTCDTDYYKNMLAKNNLYAIYKTDPLLETSTKSILEPDVLFEICETETKMKTVLEENGVCSGCDKSDECLPPHSLLLVLRLYLGDDSLELSCSDLKQKYIQSGVQEEFTNTLVECVQEIYTNYDTETSSYSATTKCPDFFEVNLVDSDFARNGNTVLRYSSSYYITYQVTQKDLYSVRPDYPLTDETIVQSVYETWGETQTNLFIESILAADTTLAVGSLTITFLAMGIHTKSIWLTFMGILQIIYSIPLSYFVYYFIAGLNFFPFLNFIGIFVAAALGADDVFVAVDKWKNARLDNPSASTQEIAAIALPDAASAMLLTTSTTAVAFFATMICPVTPIFCFAFFCGLLIMFNYFLNVIFVFPALCLYDIWLMNGSTNCLINCGCGSKSKVEDPVDEGADTKKSPIHKILSTYFYFLEKFRFFIIAASIAALVTCIVVAATMKLPDSAEVRGLLPKDNEYELHFVWSKRLLSYVLFYSGGSFGQITFGVTAADTGVKTDPDSLTTIELDNTFNPKSTEAQNYLLGFCDKLFASDLAKPINAEFQCPINAFDGWLSEQSLSADPADEYVSKCNNADSLPMSEDDFNACFIAWSEFEGEKGVLEKLGEVKIMRFRVKNQIAWDASILDMGVFWNDLEDWMSNERSNAPMGANGMFHSSAAFWWYDTNTSMFQTAIGAAGIAIGFSAVIVLISSRSLLLTLFSGVCIHYVLAAATASLVGFGWDLGFLESVCFAILIGISCDFVIHFGHAYIHLKGNVSRSLRTKYAVVHMGPSILAAAVTTFSAALAMLFCQVTFFTKFALILLMTILHATIGSFVVYLVCTVTFGPSEPTRLVDSVAMRIKQKLCNNKDSSTTEEVVPKSVHDDEEVFPKSVHDDEEVVPKSVNDDEEVFTNEKKEVHHDEKLDQVENNPVHDDEEVFTNEKKEVQHDEKLEQVEKNPVLEDEQMFVSENSKI